MKKLVLFTAIMLAASLRVYGVDTAPAVPPQVTTEGMTAVQFENLGDAMRREKNFEEAIRNYKAALKIEPKNSSLYNKIGIAELKRGNDGAAESAFQKAVKLNNMNADAFNNIGVVSYLYRKNYGRAVKYYKKALAINETNATYHSNLGAAWFSQDKLDRAMAEFGRALELDPDVLLRTSQGGVIAQVSTVEDRAKYSFILAKLYAQRGDVEHCFQSLEKAKEDGYRNLKDVYRDPEFAKVRQDPRMAQIVPPPTAVGY